jgi:MFS family permease
MANRTYASSSRTSTDETLHGSSFSFDDDEKFREEQEGKPDDKFEVDEFPARHGSASERPPPNGGLLAWLQVVGAFFLFMNSWGLINTFGVYQTYYKADLLQNHSNSNISWIGSIRAFILLGSPIIYGPIFDMGHPRLIIVSGTFLVVFGIAMTSFCTTLWQLILADGVCVGLGSGAFFLTAVAICPTYFTTRKSLAIGIAAAGSSIGGVMYPILFYKLQPQIGFGWAVRTIALIALATSAVPCFCIRMRVQSKGRRAIIDWSLFREAKFDIWVVAWLFGNMGLYIPFFFIQQYASDVSHLSQDAAFWTLIIMNAASTSGRIIPGQIADMINDPLLVIAVSTCCSTILAFCWIAIRGTMVGLYVFCAFYGFCSGAFVSLSTPATVSLAPNMDGIGTRLGMFNFVGSLGLLIGNPVAGAITELSWTGMQVFCAVASSLSFGLICAIWLYCRRRKG